MLRSRLVPLALLGATIAAQCAPAPALHLVSAPLLVCVWPGIAAARWLGLSLHVRDARTQGVVLAAGLALSPLVVFAVLQWTAFNLLAATFSLGALAVAGLLAAPRASPASTPLPISRGFVCVAVLAILGIALALAPVRNAYRDSILPLQSVVEQNDWSKHYALVWEIEQSGVPPRNLFFQQDPPVVHSYYIFFHLTVALLDLLSDGLLGISTWLVVAALLAAYALLVLVYAAGRALWGDARAALAGALAVSLVGGLDALPNAVAVLRGAGEPLFRHVDGWTSCQAEISNFITLFTWVPQHVVALALALCAWLVYADERRGRWRSPLLIALLLVASVGYSIYVPLSVALGVTCFALFNIVRQVRDRNAPRLLADGAPWLAAGLVGLVALTPDAAYELSSRLPSGGLPLALWVQTGGLPVGDFPPAAPFQFLDPRGGVMAQVLDLPAYWLFELGAALPLGVLGLLAAGGVRHRDVWRIGLFVAAASLLVGTFARSTLGCNDLGLRAVMPFQAWLALMAGGGWLALRGERSAGEPTQQASPPWPKVWAVVGLIVLALASALFAYQVPTSYRFNVLADRFAPVSGLYDVESEGGQDRRWTRPDVEVTFNDVAQNTDYRLEVRAAAGLRPAGAPPAAVQVRLNDQVIGSLSAGADPTVLMLDLPRDLVRTASSLHVALHIVPYVPARFGLGDRRELGFLLDEIILVPAGTSGLVLPPWAVLLASATIALLLAFLARARLAWVALPLLIAGALLVARAPAAAALPFVALGLAFALCVHRGVPRLATWLRARLATGPSMVLSACVGLLLAIGMVTVAWIVLSYDLSRFLPPIDSASAQRDAYGIAYAGAVRAVRERAPANAIIQLDPHRGDHMWWGLAMERRNYFVIDEVFAYQFAPALRETRLVQVAQAYEMPTLLEACDRFKRLGIDFVVAEPRASDYPWLADVHDPDACLHAFYDDLLVLVLERRR